MTTHLPEPRDIQMQTLSDDKFQISYFSVTEEISKISDSNKVCIKVFGERELSTWRPDGAQITCKAVTNEKVQDALKKILAAGVKNPNFSFEWRRQLKLYVIILSSMAYHGAYYIHCIYFVHIPQDT